MTILEFSRDFLAWLNAHQGVGAVDGIDIHLYANGAYRTGQAINRMKNDFDEVVRGHTNQGFANMQKWITEIGFPGDDPNGAAGYKDVADNASTRNQRNRLREAYMRFTGSQVKSFIAYRFMMTFQTHFSATTTEMRIGASA